jgi:hypothetical protein
MEWEQLFVNGIYDFGGKPLPIDKEKCLFLICKNDASDAFLHLQHKATIEYICFTCGCFESKKIYKNIKDLIKKMLVNEESFDTSFFKKVTQHYYRGLIETNNPGLSEKLLKFLNKKKIKCFRRVRITTFLFQKKNYPVLEKILFLLKPTEIATALTDAQHSDIETYEFALKFMTPHDLLEIVIVAAYEYDINIYKDKIKYLREKIAPHLLGRLNQECFKLLGVQLNYF